MDGVKMLRELADQLEGERRLSRELVAECVLALEVYRGQPAPVLGGWNWPEMSARVAALLERAGVNT